MPIRTKQPTTRSRKKGRCTNRSSLKRERRMGSRSLLLSTYCTRRSRPPKRSVSESEPRPPRPPASLEEEEEEELRLRLLLLRPPEEDEEELRLRA